MPPAMVGIMSVAWVAAPSRPRCGIICSRGSAALPGSAHSMWWPGHRRGAPPLRDPAGQGGRLPDPGCHPCLVELIVLAYVDVPHLLVLRLARGHRTQ